MNDARTLAQRVQACLHAHHVMTLATATAARPWAAAVFYAHQDTSLYFLSSPATRHAGDIARNPRVALTIQQDDPDWTHAKGLQIQGRARRLEPPDAATARAVYFAKFPRLAASDQSERLRMAFERIAWYAVDAEQVCLIDNALGFGHHDRLSLGLAR